MHKEDKILKDFFTEIKRLDEEEAIPSFDQMTDTHNKERTISPRYLIAACFTLVIISFAIIWIKPDAKSNEILAKEEIDIVPELPDELINWEEPTKSLLEEF